MFFNEYPYRNLEDLNLDYWIKKIKDTMKRVALLETWKAEHENEYLQLKELYDAVMSGNFPPSIINAFNNWMAANALDLVGHLVKQLFFGLTDDGYFVAYIPESWDDIVFGTSGYDTIIPDLDYGHLILSY